MDLPAHELAQLLEQREWLRRLARALVGADEADDLAQEAWLAALRQARTPGEPRAWLAAIAHNLARGLRRSRGRRAQRDRRAARAEALPSTEELVERLDTEQRLARELAGLREPYRTTLLLRFHEGLGAEEIARRQGVPAGTVRWRTRTGLAQLRERLERALGGREAFGLALLPLARGGVPGTSVAAASGGGVLMGVLWKGLSVAAALGLGAVVVVRLDSAEAVGGDGDVAQGTPPLEDPAEGTAARATDVARAAAPAKPSPADARIAPGNAADTHARLRILESDGTPHAGMRVAARAAGAGPARELRTDEQGRLTLEPHGTPLELAIERVGAFAQRCELVPQPGEQELRLADGLELSGHVVVQDGAAPGDIALTLVPAGADWWSLDPPEPFTSARIVLRTEADGRFAFRALGAASYDLAFPPGYRESGGGESDPHLRLVLRDLRPARGLVLEVERLPRITGRLVEADGRTPTAGVVECRFTWADGTNMDSGARADEDGRFELVPGEPWRALALEFWGLPGERGRTRAEFQERALGADWDLGDLRLVQGRAFTLRVRDPGGNPVVGARTDLAAPPTDERGETRVMDVSAEAVRVVARGFHEQRAILTAGVETVEVTLEPAPELFLELRDRRGVAVGGLLVELRAERWLFDQDSPSLLLSAMREGRLVMWDEEPFAARYTTDAAGRLRCDALAPGLPFELRVFAHGGAVVNESVQAPLGRDERRVLPVVLAREGCELRVRVLDEHGTPVRGARLSLPAIRAGSVTHGNEHRTDEHGRLRCALLDLPFRLRLHHPGYLALEREFVRAPAEELELVLERGLDVTVRVLDEAGSPQAGGQLFVAGLEPTSSAPGRFEVRGLTAGEHAFVLRLGGREFVRAHPAHEPELEFRVPVMGALEARWELPLAAAGGRFVQLELHARADERLALQHGLFDTPAGARRFDPLAPGEYEVRLTTEDGESERVLAGARATVVSGQTATVRLEATR